MGSAGIPLAKGQQICIPAKDSSRNALKDAIITPEQENSNEKTPEAVYIVEHQGAVAAGLAGVLAVVTTAVVAEAAVAIIGVKAEAVAGTKEVVAVVGTGKVEVAAGSEIEAMPAGPDSVVAVVDVRSARKVLVTVGTNAAATAPRYTDEPVAAAAVAHASTC